MPNTYIPGQAVLLQDLITNPATGLPVDDASAAVTIYKPDGSTATPAVTHGSPSSGQYTAQLTVDLIGFWEYVWKSTGAGAGASRGRFYVSPVP